jgi:DMSO/TMAO reductase YedYZ heme-binding membrane subunit
MTFENIAKYVLSPIISIIASYFFLIFQLNTDISKENFKTFFGSILSGILKLLIVIIIVYVTNRFFGKSWWYYLSIYAIYLSLSLFIFIFGILILIFAKIVKDLPLLIRICLAIFALYYPLKHGIRFIIGYFSFNI